MVEAGKFVWLLGVTKNKEPYSKSVYFVLWFLLKKFLIFPDMVLVMLSKTDQGQKWAGVTAEDAKATEARKPKMNSDDPSAGMMDLMKQMYDEGDDKMKQVGLSCSVYNSTLILLCCF